MQIKLLVTKMRQGNCALAVLLTLSILTAACELKREYTGDLFPVSPPKLVCYALLGNETPTAVYLFPTTSYLDTSAAAFVPDAEVSLWRNGAFLEELSYEGRKYVASEDMPVSPEDAFELLVRHPDYGEVVSAPVVVPTAVQIDATSWSYSMDSTRIIATVVLRDTLGLPFWISAYLFSDPAATERLGSGSVRVSDALPLEEGLVQYQVSFAARFTVFENFVPVDTVPVARAQIRISHLSEEYYWYHSTIPDGDFGGFFPPQDTLYTNIEGGQGVFFAISTATYWIEL